MFKFRKLTPGEPLVVTMAAVRMGDRLLIVGADAPALIAQLALKPGLTGRTCLVDEDATRTEKAAALSQSEGALLEQQTAPPTQLPYEREMFDVVVVNHLLARVDADRRAQCLAEAARVLRDGGRCVIVQPGRRSGIAGLLSGSPALSAADVEALMTSAGLRAVHTLAEREGLLFVEGAKRS